MLAPIPFLPMPASIPIPSRFLLLCLASTGALLPDARADTASWTGWRGAARDARVEHFAPPEVWPEALERAWRVEVGTGYATPVVVGGRIYQHAREGDEEVLRCLELGSGRSVWRKSMPVAFEPGRGGERHGRGPKSTPAYADDRIFTMSITGTVAAWSADDGDLLWKRDFRERFQPAHPYWGTATSPLVDQGRLFVHPGSCEDGALFCLDPATGEDVWVQDAHANCYSSPFIETVDGVRQLIGLNHDGLCGIDLASGRVLWHYTFPHHGNNQNTPTPVFHDGVFVVGAEDRGIFGVRPRRVDGEWSVERIWRHREVSLDMSSPVVLDGAVYGFSEFKTGQLFCLDPMTGKVHWTGEPRGGDNAQLLSVAGHALVLNDRGDLQVLRANRERCEVVRRYQVAEDATWAAPALLGDALLVKDRTHLALWRFPARSEE